MLEKEFAQSQDELTKLLMLLPDQKEIPGLLENVSRLGSKVGLENILFQPQPETVEEYYAVIPIRIDLSARSTTWVFFWITSPSLTES